MTTKAPRVGRDLTIEERRTAVLRAAYDCVAETGFGNLRLRDVAQAAGVSTGLLQHYFATRDELVAATFRQASEDSLGQWDEIVLENPEPWERIEALVSMLAMREPFRKYSMVWVSFADAAARTPAIREVFKPIYERWQQSLLTAIADGVEQGLFQPLMPPADIADVLLNQLDGAQLLSASDPDSDMTGTRMRALGMRMTATLLNHEFVDTRDLPTTAP